MSDPASPEEPIEAPELSLPGEPRKLPIPPVRGGPVAAAFFDLDKTVVAKSSTLAFGRELAREGLLTTGHVLKGTYAQLVYQVLGADADRMEKSRAALLELTRGWEAERVRRLVRETLQEVIDPLIYEEALALFEAHRAAGRALYLVSSSGEEIVAPLADYLGVPHVLATRAGVDADGRYDGTLEFYCYAEHKAEAVRAEAERRGLDLHASFAYSDSITDLPMLEAVGYPVAVNPDRELRQTAADRSWPVRDFRHPVSLRQRLGRLPRPATDVVAGAGALSLVGAATWWWWWWQHRQPTGTVARLRDAAPTGPLRPRSPLAEVRRSAGRSVRAVGRPWRSQGPWPSSRGPLRWRRRTWRSAPGPRLATARGSRWRR